MKYRDGFRDMKISPRSYFYLLIFSVVCFGIVVPGAINILLSQYLSGPVAYVVYLVPLFIVFVVGMLPLISSSQRKIKVDRIFPLYITELAALSTSEMSIDRIFNIISEKKIYGPLADDSRRMYRLIKHYNVSAAEACRFVAVRTPSVQEADFFNRLGHALEIGETMSRFMYNEHDVIMSEYVLRSESSLKDLDFVKEVYTGMVTSMIFICVFISIIPLLGTMDIDIILLSIVLGFAIMEGTFIYYIGTKVPRDNIWLGWRNKSRSGYFTDLDRTLIISIVVAVLGVVILFLLLLPLNLPPLLLVSSTFLPILIPGFLITREERRIEKRDNIYGAFIRSLGRSSSVAGITMVEAVKKLAMHKFGPLTAMVQNLSKRLRMHIDPKISWKHFSSESSSHLIDRFGDMYTECALNGSKPDETSLFISDNMFKILSIRKKRTIIASNFFGVLYGVMISLAFTLWITIGITQYMGDVMGGIKIADEGVMDEGFLSTILNSDFDIGPLRLMAFGVILVHAFFSSLMLPLMRGGHIMSAAIHL
ncbi:MAG: archaellar assembly protein FlaJ, partial [Methanomassiliicoccales archaeon]|nr:archaellar assembly protein FlaJ [Methanomassiliicoccales archaeon]